MRAIPYLTTSVERRLRPVLRWAGGTLLTAAVTVNLLAGPLGIHAGYRHAGPAAVLAVLALTAALLWRWPLTALRHADPDPTAPDIAPPRPRLPVAATLSLDATTAALTAS
jgi:hypothetical protein